MSVRMLSAVWQTDLPSTEKLVLLALADAANDDGNCWPPINGEKGLCRKTSLSERAVQSAIKSLCERGVLSRMENPGKGVFYTLTPAADAPPQIPRPAAHAPTPARRAPKPSVTVNTSIAKAISVARDDFPRPDFADAQLWKDFLTNRRKKRLPNTATAHKGLLEDIARLANGEWPPGKLFEYAVRKGWGGIYEPKDYDNGRRTGNGMAGAGQSASRTLGAIADFIQDGRRE